MAGTLFVVGLVSSSFKPEGISFQTTATTITTTIINHHPSIPPPLHHRNCQHSLNSITPHLAPPPPPNSCPPTRGRAPSPHTSRIPRSAHEHVAANDSHNTRAANAPATQPAHTNAAACKGCAGAGVCRAPDFLSHQPPLGGAWRHLPAGKSILTRSSVPRALAVHRKRPLSSIALRLSRIDDEVTDGLNTFRIAGP
ncbi:hypothetical protein EJ06DRAFT_385648 [Trichodelitschia bisporula]|uniref:Uncharacterized protein n=1 Tax=Trichodelitschia bisporula TaxID=703511 RepID=A0A6G1HZL2_9PEZI|nr:hypothetical protein EJ06DRAFT_385648 [Trichodelitschia bisporula]